MFGNLGCVISIVQMGSCLAFLGAVTFVFVAAFGRRLIGGIWVVTTKVVGAPHQSCMWVQAAVWLSLTAAGSMRLVGGVLARWKAMPRITLQSLSER